MTRLVPVCRTGTTGFYSALEDSFESEGLNITDVILGGDGSLRLKTYAGISGRERLMISKHLKSPGDSSSQMFD